MGEHVVADHTELVRRLAFAEPPGSAAAVMASAVLSVCFAMTGPLWLSDTLFAVAAVVWVALVSAFFAGLLVDPLRWVDRCEVPPSLTLVAGTAVLGTRITLLGVGFVGTVLLILGTVMWLGMLPAVLRHWHVPTVGSSFLVCVSTQALVILAGRVAMRAGESWPVWVSGAAFVLGLVLYGVVAGHLDLRQVTQGAGDQWVTSGALAISAVAASALQDAAGAVAGGSRFASSALGISAQVLWWAAVVVAVPLAVGEWIAPRVHYGINRWGTAFPVGMLALAALTISRHLRQQALWDAGHVLTWVALAIWLLLAAGALRRSRIGRWSVGTGKPGAVVGRRTRFIRTHRHPVPR